MLVGEYAGSQQSLVVLDKACVHLIVQVLEARLVYKMLILLDNRAHNGKFLVAYADGIDIIAVFVFKIRIPFFLQSVRITDIIQAEAVADATGMLAIIVQKLMQIKRLLYLGDNVGKSLKILQKRNALRKPYAIRYDKYIQIYTELHIFTL